MIRFALSALAALCLSAAAPAHAQTGDAPDFAERVEGADHREGLFDLYVDAADGEVLAALPAAENGFIGRYIYTPGLTAGMGSNPVGLDRGRLGPSWLVRLERAGDRVLVIAENPAFHAAGADPIEQRATHQSFAESVLSAWPVEAEQDDGGVLVDLTAFLVSDVMGLGARLRDADQGDFSVDAQRSAPVFDAAFAFPLNVEIDARVTLTGARPGGQVQAVTPDPRAVTLIQHHSFAALPEPGYTPLPADPRSGAIELTWQNTAAPLAEPVRSGYALRHRLETNADGEVVEPIVFYVDPGAPAAVRDALVEGGNWWAEAFEAAGFPGGYRVEILPEGAHPLDVRYNTIQWVHRETRGWSYGQSITDPRTGEILKGAVILGSQRVRQDRMIFEGLLGAARTGTGAADDPITLSLARIRQLSAHEIGHTIGLLHNFAASTNDRASVMDYPAPLITLDATGGFDVSDAYDVGIGEWDIAAIRWLYAETDAAGREAILQEARAAGLAYLSDRHARGNDSAVPEASLWDNGADPVAHLEAVLDVRRAGLERFSAATLAEGRRLSDLRAVFVPVYLHHRFQTEAAAKAIGGRRFEYQVNAGVLAPVSPVSPDDQRYALSLLTSTLEPVFLRIDAETMALLQPDPTADYDPAVRLELFDSSSYPAFSNVDAAMASARITLEALLSGGRLARVVDQHDADPAQLSPGEVFDAVEAVAFDAPRREDARLKRLREAVQTVYADQLLALAAAAPPRVQALARARADAIAGRGGSDAHVRWLAARVEAGLSRIDDGDGGPSRAGDIPPGSPIGTP